MAEIIFFFVFAVPALLGLSEIIHSVKLWLYSVKNSPGGILVIVPTNGNFESMIMNAAAQRDWYGKRYAEKIIVVSSLLDDVAACKCNALAEKYDLTVCSRYEICEEVLK